jgi:hypothetical protein
MLIFADSMFLGRMTRKLKRNKINGSLLYSNLDKAGTTRISKNLDASIRIRVNGTSIKKEDKFIYLLEK